MRLRVRLTRHLFEIMQRDLDRPHPIAYERVGFAFGAWAEFADTGVVLVSEYVPVDDAHYIEGPGAATIGPRAIFEAHAVAGRTRRCCLHVHRHEGAGPTWFSPVDLKTLRDLAPSLARLSPACAHGGLVLTRTRASGLLWPPSTTEARSPVTIVGIPMAMG